MQESGLQLTGKTALLSSWSGGDSKEQQEQDSEEKHIDRYGCSSIDSILINIYNYYADHGYQFIITQSCMNAVVSVFSTILFAWLLFYVHWIDILKGRTENVFGFSDTLFTNRPTDMEIVCLLWISAACLYCAWELVSACYSIKYAVNTRRLYTEALEITENELPSLTALDVFQRVISKHQDGKLPCLGSSSITVPQIVARIMRIDNVFIALVSCKSKLLPQNMSTTLQSALYSCIVHGLFNADRYTLNPNFLDSSKLLQKRIRRQILYNVVSWIFVPFLTVVQAFFFHMYCLYTEKSLANPFRWSVYAHWKLRDINEVSHVFTRRLELATRYSNRFLQLYPDYSVSQFHQGVTRIAGSVVSVLFVFTLINSQLLTLESLFGIPLLWYLTVSGTIVMVSRGYMVSAQNKIADAAKVKEQLVACCHLPELTQQSNVSDIKKIIQQLFRAKFTNIFYEILGQFITPFQLSNLNTSEIIAFLSQNMSHHPKIGSILTCSLPLTENEGMSFDELSQSDHLELPATKLETSMLLTELTASNIDIMSSFTTLRGAEESSNAV